MPNVFATNKTSSSITVSSWTVHFINSADAEIVEVEGQGGGGSTSSDDATGTISGVTLPTAHSYTGVSFDSLRYYVKGTLSNTGSEYAYYFGMVKTWYKGTITWTDETLGDLSDRIVVNPPDDSIGNKQTTFKIIFIDETPIGGTHAYDTGDSPNSSFGYVTDYTYSNGTHSITYWYPDFPWYAKSYSGRIQFRYLNGVTTFQNLSAFDLVNVSGGSLSKATTTDRYGMYNAWNKNITLHALYSSAETIRRNAFKYLLNGTPYWYVIDGEHDTWTDDLSEWGYSEVPVGPVLPEVSIREDFGTNNWVYVNPNQTAESLGSNASLDTYYYDVSQMLPSAYGTSKSYAVIQWQTTSGTTAGRTECVFINHSDRLAIKNVSSSTISIKQARVAVCSSNQATVVTVYDSSNNAYNAFKYTTGGVDYYYVLDGTQTDWTDDLSSIGYSLYLTAYTTTMKDPTSIPGGTNGPLYNALGEYITLQGTPTFVRYYTSASDIVGTYDSDLRLTDGWYGLTLHSDHASGTSITIQRIEYTVS